jgi:hypothetical protein
MMKFDNPAKSRQQKVINGLAEEKILPRLLPEDTQPQFDRAGGLFAKPSNFVWNISGGESKRLPLDLPPGAFFLSPRENRNQENPSVPRRPLQPRPEGFPHGNFEPRVESLFTPLRWQDSCCPYPFPKPSGLPDLVLRFERINKKWLVTQKTARGVNSSF